MAGGHFQTLGLPVNQSVSPLEGSVNAFSDRALAPHQDRNWVLRLPPPLAKGGKGEVRVLGCHHRRGKEGKGQCIRSSGQLAPGDEATLRLQRFGPNM